MNTPDTTPIAALALPEDPTTIDEQAVAVALETTEGQAFAFGGKTFHLTYLSVAGQNALDKMLKPWMAGGATLSPEEMLIAIADSLAPAASLILGEQDPEATVAWIEGLKEKGIRARLFELVMAQVGLDEVGKFYAVLSYTAAALRQAAGVA